MGARLLPCELVGLSFPCNEPGRCQSAAGFRILIAVTAARFVAKNVVKRLLPTIGKELPDASPMI
jgi:hypothetical protein